MVQRVRHRKERCYVCSDPATSNDHTPPKMIFPAPKDSDGIDYRMDLIRVPACDEHNNSFSKDDEYLSVVLCSHIRNNEVGNKHFGTKVLRALQNSQGLANAVFKNARHILVDGEETISFQIDPPRFDRCIRKVTAGLYYHLTGYRLPDWDIMKVLSPDLYNHDSFKSPHSELLPLFRERPEWSTLTSGHPDVYRCRYVIAQERLRHFVFEHTFYGGMRIWVLSAPTDALWLAAKLAGTLRT